MTNSSRRRILKRLPRVLSSFCSLAIISVSLISNSKISQAQTPTFWEFSGVNQCGDTNDSLLTNAVSWARLDIPWQSVEPSQGNWNQTYLDSIGQKVLAFQAKGVQFLPVLDYTVQWAADRSARQFDHGNTRWIITPQSGGTLKIEKYLKQTNGTYTLSTTSINDGSDLSKWPPAAVADWQDYVNKVVTYLSAAPYNVKYFQVWNEAYPTSGFWFDSMENYFNKIHKPAATIIRNKGCKVVYGGWPAIASYSAMRSNFDTYNVWGTFDVADVHYYFTPTMDAMRQDLNSRGYTNTAIWQTEIAFTNDPLFVGNNYPRMLYWGLGNNWNAKDKYKVFFFAHKSPDDPAAYGYGKMLKTGTNLSPHGKSLQTIGNLLTKGTVISRFTGTTSTPALSYSMDENASSLEGFNCGTKVVLAIHLKPSDYTANTTITLNIPLQRTLISSAQRYNLTNTSADVTSSLVANGTSTKLTVSTRDATGSDPRTWNDATTHAATFYVVLNKGTSALTASGTQG